MLSHAQNEVRWLNFNLDPKIYVLIFVICLMKLLAGCVSKERVYI